MFLDKSSDEIFVNILGHDKSFRLLQKFEFTPDRKKMSVII